MSLREESVATAEERNAAAFREALSRFWKDKKITRLAEVVGISASAIYSWKKKIPNDPTKELIAVCNEIGVDPSAICRGEVVHVGRSYQTKPHSDTQFIEKIEAILQGPEAKSLRDYVEFLAAKSGDG